ncbi:MAG: alpha/beta hydrolase family protein [Proteobacteria bacterium]|nr:alpha/beta hydrolase family protein [Pseudomonadota bacterium]
MTPIPFDVPFPGRLIKADHLAGRAKLPALLIHGAGQSERGRFAPLRSALLRRGIASTAFDCVGHGQTGGLLCASSLASRTRQAAAVADARHGASPLAVVGTSMGAYNAIKLLEARQVESLVLVVPGVYTPAAYELPFDAGFSAVIRAQRSWEATDAWDIVGRFTGRLLVIAAQNDTVIPPEIPWRLVEAAGKASWRQLHVVADAQHNRLFSLLAERPAAFAETIELIFACLAPTV